MSRADQIMKEINKDLTVMAREHPENQEQWAEQATRIMTYEGIHAILQRLDELEQKIDEIKEAK